MFWLSEDNETLWSENRTQWEEQGWNCDASDELVIFILEILEKNWRVIADGGPDIEGDSDSLEELYKPLAQKRQNIGPAIVPQVRLLRDAEVRIHQGFSLNHPGVLYFIAFLLTAC